MQKSPKVKKCTHDGCNNPLLAKGYCNKHWLRNRKGTDLDAPEKIKNGASLEWLMNHRQYAGDDCLIWPHSYKSNGYGNCHFRGRSIAASRVMCILVYGNPPNGFHSHAAHSCGNRACVNPLHLRWATAAENCKDIAKHGRVIRGALCANSKLTENDILKIRQEYKPGNGPELAEKFGVRPGYIQKIVHRRVWAWL